MSSENSIKIYSMETPYGKEQCFTMGDALELTKSVIMTPHYSYHQSNKLIRFGIRKDVEDKEPTKKAKRKIRNRLPPISRDEIPQIIAKESETETAYHSREVSILDPTPGVTIIEKGFNKSNKLEGGVTKDMYIKQYHKIRFQPAPIAESASALSVYEEHPQVIEPIPKKKCHYDRRNGGISSSNNSCYRDLLANEETHKQESQFFTSSIEPKEFIEPSSIDNFNKEIVHSRNWGSEFVKTTLRALTLPHLKNTNIKARNRLGVNKKDSFFQS